jgi:integrase
VRGHIRKRGKTWSAVIHLGNDPVTGKRRYKWDGGHRTREDAERAMVKLLAKVHDGSYVEPTRQTVGVYLDDWFRRARLDLRASSVPFYEIAINSYITPRIGNVPLRKLNAQALNDLYAELLTEGRCQREGGLSASTVRRVHALIRKALGDAIEARVIEWNPAAHAKPPKASTANEQARRKRRFLDVEEVRRFLDACAGHRLEAGFQLSAMTGMRRGEVLGLRWRDIDMDAARLVVEQTLVSPRYVMSFSEPKTSQGRRSIDLDPLTVQKLKTHRARQAAEQLAFGDGYADSGLVFRQPDGQPVQPALFTLAFKQMAKKAKLGPIRLHDLRHTQVALLASAGVPAKVVSERLGHHSAGFTLDSYGGTFPAQHQEAAAKLAAMVEG